jgi:hypothetical protein
MFDAKSMFSLPAGVETRWASPENPTGAKGAGGKAKGGRKGSAWCPLKAGEQRVLAQVSGTSGTVRRMWMTMSDRSPQSLRGLRLDAYWDGADKPAISAPLGDFFGTGLGRQVAFESALFSSPEGRSFNCYIPMPFRTGMKLVLTNESNNDQRELYYDIDYTIGDTHAADMLYFHAHWRRERFTTLRRDYEFLPLVSGKGRFVGVNLGIVANRETYFHSWWGEGECKVYLDGDREWPTLCGTGTEDYVGSAWELGRFANMYQGGHLIDHDAGQYCFYRYHVHDPIWFHQDVRVTMQQIGNYSPESKAEFLKAKSKYFLTDSANAPLQASSPEYGLLEREDDWSSCAYFYLGNPVNELPPLVPVGLRTEAL